MVMAQKVFESMLEKDVRSWSSLLDGYVKAGEYREAMAVFEKMQAVGPKANEVTTVSVSCACAHLGALEKGRMIHKYIVDNGWPLTLVLQTSLVDMYAKCGAIEEALLIFHCVSKSQTDVLIWNAVIGGLATHGLVEESLKLFKEMQIVGICPDEVTYLCLLAAYGHGGIVKEEAWKLIELEPNHDGRYFGLSNMYVVGKCWDDARSMREAMERRGVKKSPGFSFVEISGVLHSFIAHDKTHPDSEETYFMLNFVVYQMKLSCHEDNQERSLDVSMEDDLLIF
ncbi:hypothetical protein JHK87_029406 [Glycine soja]|nr:hypothetical protein JHK87_029406 [Glycine soja]